MSVKVRKCAGQTGAASGGLRGLRAGKLAGVAGVALVVAGHAGAAGAQETAGGGAQVIDLPTIEVTADTPVAARQNAGAGQDPVPGMLIVPLRSFAPVSVVSRSDIARNQPQSLGEAVADIPGVSATTFAPGASRPVIRGLDNFRVSIQENGVGASGVSALGEDHAAPVSPLTAERIEVIRGPATLRFGSQAIGGVVSLDNNRIPEKAINGVNARLMNGVSSANRGYSSAGEVNAGAGNVAVHADFFRQKSGAYATPDGRQANSGVNTGGAAIGGSVITDSGFIGLAYSHLNNNYQIPGGESAELRSRIDMVEDRIVLKGEHRPASAWIEAIRFWAGASNYRHREYGLAHGKHDHDHGHDHDHDHDVHGHEDHDHDHGGGGATAAGETLHSTFYNRQQEARVEAQHTPVATALGTWSGAFGVHGARQKLSATGEGGGMISPAETRSIAAYLFEELKINDSWRLQFAGRMGYVNVDGSAAQFPADYLPDGVTPVLSPRSRDFAPKSVSAGVQYTLPWHNIVATLNAQYVERAPTAAELFSRGAHHASGTFEIGDPNLKTERARTIEFSLKKADGPVRFEGSVYHTKYSGFIYKRLTGVGCGDTFASCGSDGELRQIVYSQQGATFTGAEFIGQFDLAKLGDGSIGVEGRYDYVRAKFDDGTWVPRLPQQRVGGGVYYRSDALFARVLLTHAFARNDVAEYETRTPGYNNLKAELNYRMKLPANGIGAKEAVFGIVGDNLLNDRMRNSVSFKKDEVLLPGRTVRAQVTVSF
ncbi:TonB-dependent receptor [Camelimonas sp. ID_303_24]